MLQNVEMAKLLLEHGADINVRSLTIDCPLHQAIEKGNFQLIELLLQAGADTTYSTVLGGTIFDDWPRDLEIRRRLVDLLDKHGVTKPE